MLLDPFTVGAQILNFLILVWLLRKILYGPVTRAMNEREARIRGELDEARRLRAEAGEERARHQAQVAAFTADQETRLAAAREELEAWRHAQMDVARQEIDARRQRWQTSLAHEQQTVIRDVRQRVGHEILSLTRQALRDLADSDLEERVIARFLAQLRDLPPEDRTRLREGAREDGQRVHLRTAQPLADQDRARLRDAVTGVLGEDVTPDFAIAPELGSGVELRAGGFKVAWSLTAYLTSLDERLNAAFGDAPAMDGAND